MRGGSRKAARVFPGQYGMTGLSTIAERGEPHCGGFAFSHADRWPAQPPSTGGRAERTRVNASSRAHPALRG